MLIGRKQMKLTGILGSASLAVLAMAGNAHAADKYVVGVSNTLIGNGWREEMICSIKAEAEASGKVSKVIVANRNGGPSEQIADIRNLISAGANIIIINPSDREALNPVIKQAAYKGIVVVAVDQAVSALVGRTEERMQSVASQLIQDLGRNRILLLIVAPMMLKLQKEGM